MRSSHLTVIVLSLMVLSRAIDVRLESGADLTFNTSMMRDTGLTFSLLDWQNKVSEIYQFGSFESNRINKWKIKE